MIARFNRLIYSECCGQLGLDVSKGFLRFSGRKVLRFYHTRGRPSDQHSKQLFQTHCQCQFLWVSDCKWVSYCNVVYARVPRTFWWPFHIHSQWFEFPLLFSSSRHQTVSETVLTIFSRYRSKAHSETFWDCRPVIKRFGWEFIEIFCRASSPACSYLPTGTVGL